ncbi:MAG: DUF1080 domain-containing protein [Candidatus Solibacter usitatus]|nr:DUF1080 domain-containing protein [Candidatus Solibacter usitatus]
MKSIFTMMAVSAALWAQAPNTLSKQEQAAGWRLLFDGKTTQGWQAAGADTWAVEDGCLKALPRPVLREDLISTQEFGDFELSFEWKVAAGSNSGVKYKLQDAVLVDARQLPDPKMQFEKQVAYFMKNRAARREAVQRGSGAQVYTVAFEYQVIDDEKHTDALHNAASRAGALYRMAAPSKNVVKPVGEFNQGRIVLRGKHVEHWLNGVKVVEIDLDSAQVRASVEERWEAGHPVRELLEKMPKARCPVALQHHNDAAWFRNVKIRELK